MSSGPPFYYDYANRVDGTYSPSELHLSDNATSRYWERYLLQKAIAVFNWVLPETWAENYFLYVLYSWGFLAIINTDKFGVIPQGCGLRGYDVFYQPTNAIISNPLLQGLRDPRIGVDCVLMRLQPNYNGIMDIVHYYAVQLAACHATLVTNLLNSKLAYVMGAANKNEAETLKKLYDDIQSGVPAVVARTQSSKTLADNASPFMLFNQSLKQTFIAPDIIDVSRAIELAFDREVGIPTVNESKGERLIRAEVERNSLETQSKCALWLQELQKSCEAVHNMFGLTKKELWVDWREVPANGSNPINMGSLSMGQNNIR